MNDSFWATACGCQANDCYELLKTFLHNRGEILGVEAARFLGFDLEAVQPLLRRLLEEGFASAEDQGFTRFYHWRGHSPPPA